jgi:hypothetical protein
MKGTNRKLSAARSAVALTDEANLIDTTAQENISEQFNALREWHGRLTKS